MFIEFREGEFVCTDHVVRFSLSEQGDMFVETVTGQMLFVERDFVDSLRNVLLDSDEFGGECSDTLFCTCDQCCGCDDDEPEEKDEDVSVLLDKAKQSEDVSDEFVMEQLFDELADIIKKKAPASLGNFDMLISVERE